MGKRESAGSNFKLFGKGLNAVHTLYRKINLLSNCEVFMTYTTILPKCMETHSRQVLPKS